MKVSKLALASLFVASSAFAHQFFPMKTDNGYKVGFWADDHWGVFQNDRVFGASAANAQGKIKTSFNYNDASISIEGKPSVASISYDFGYYTFTKNGKHYAAKRSDLTDKDGANEVTQTRRIFKMGKSIFAWDAASQKPLGLKLEIVPLENPLDKKVGDTFKFQVLLDGKPVAGAELEDQVDDIKGIETDKNGIAKIKLREPVNGLQIIAAGVKIPYNLDRYGDTLQLTATLSFQNK